MSYILFSDIVKHGNYYYPAWRHYGQEISVMCDRCKKNNLYQCIGYGKDSDLCMSCVEKVSEFMRNDSFVSVQPVICSVQPVICPRPIRPTNPMNPMNPRDPNSVYISDNRISIADSDQLCTMMCQNMFNK